MIAIVAYVNSEGFAALDGKPITDAQRGAWVADLRARGRNAEAASLGGHPARLFRVTPWAWHVAVDISRSTYA